MPTGPLSGLLQDHELALVFWNVLFEELGLPIPAVPTLVVAIRVLIVSRPRHRAADHRTTQPGRSCLGRIVGASEHQRCNH